MRILKAYRHGDNGIGTGGGVGVDSQLEKWKVGSINNEDNPGCIDLARDGPGLGQVQRF